MLSRVRPYKHKVDLTNFVFYSSTLQRTVKYKQTFWMDLNKIWYVCAAKFTNVKK